MSEQIKSSDDSTLVNTNTVLLETDNHPKKEYNYVVLMETSGEECESWYYCIRYEGNEKNLKYLQDQLESVDWYIIDDLSTFDLDLEHFISDKTAKQLTKLELNHYSFHRKFDGILDKVDLNLRKKDNNEKKMSKIFDILGYGQIEDYIDDEDLDEEDLTDTQQSSSEESDSSDEDEDKHKDEDEDKDKNKAIPSMLQKTNLPRFALVKQHKHKGKKY